MKATIIIAILFLFGLSYALRTHGADNFAAGIAHTDSAIAVALR